MLYNAKELKNYVLLAKDGEIGRCKDLLFDDKHWTIRYMVANTGKWLRGRKVLISPIALNAPDWVSKLFPLHLTKKQIEQAPGLDQNAPVSKQYEKDWLQYYGWAAYWGGTHAWGLHPHPGLLYGQDQGQNKLDPETSRDDHLRSVDEVTGYHIQAKDHEIGHVEDFLIEDSTWRIRYIVVDTRNWLPGKKVIVAPAWITSIDWGERKADVDLTREEDEKSPEYNHRLPLDRADEEQLYNHYGRTNYWE